MNNSNLPLSAAAELQTHIESCYQQPLAELRSRVQDDPHPDALLAALLGLHERLDFAERGIGFQLDRLRRLIDPGRQIGRFEVSHILDCAQRLAQAVAARDAHLGDATPVLRAARPAPTTPPTTGAPTPTARSTTASRTR